MDEQISYLTACLMVGLYTSVPLIMLIALGREVVEYVGIRRMYGNVEIAHYCYREFVRPYLFGTLVFGTIWVLFVIALAVLYPGGKYGGEYPGGDDMRAVGRGMDNGSI